MNKLRLVFAAGTALVMSLGTATMAQAQYYPPPGYYHHHHQLVCGRPVLRPTARHRALAPLSPAAAALRLCLGAVWPAIPADRA